MDEEKEKQKTQIQEKNDKVTEGTGKEETTNDSSNGEKPEEKKLSPLEEARKFNQDTKKQLAEMKLEREKIEAAAAEMLVNGRSLAGNVQKQKTPEEKLKEETMNFFKGTEIEKAIAKHG